MTVMLQPTMLWEATDPLVALTKRFQFATPEAATAWLIATIAGTYGIDVLTVDRLSMSADNLIGWLTTTEGGLLVKCCAWLPAHERLLAAGELVVWLAQRGLLVSAPLMTLTGRVQVQCDHLSVSVQRLVAGALLDPTQLTQAYSAGVTLAQLHQALASYPQATALTSPAPVPSLSTVVGDWGKATIANLTDPDLTAAGATLSEQAAQLTTTPLATQLIHGDFRAANVLWQAGQIAAVLDFDDVRWGYRVNDLAWAAVHLGTRYHDWGPVAREVHDAFLRGYRDVQPLTALEQAWLPVLLLWHSISLTQAAAGKPTYPIGLEAIAFYRHLLQSGT